MKQNFSIVFGYLPNVEPKRNFSRNLKKKFSLILSTFSPEKGEMFFDFKLMTVLLDFTLSKFMFDEIQFYLNEKEFVNFKTSEDLIEYFEKNLYNEKENELSFLKLICSYNNEPILLILPEDYTGIGGSEPYHDSITYTFLYENFNEENYLKDLQELSNQKSLNLDKIFKGNDRHENTWTEKMKSILSQKN